MASVRVSDGNSAPATVNGMDVNGEVVRDEDLARKDAGRKRQKGQNMIFLADTDSTPSRKVIVSGFRSSYLRGASW